MNLKDKRLNKKYIQLKSGETLHQTLCHPVKLNTDTNKEKKTRETSENFRKKPWKPDMATNEMWRNPGNG